MRKLFWTVFVGFTSVACLAQQVIKISINDAQVVEGNSGTTNAEFIMSLSMPWTNTITIQYTTFEDQPDINQPYVAKADIDFISTSGTVTFAPGETNKSVFVPVIGDTINEGDEVFGLGLYPPSAGELERSSAQCTIFDNDPLEIYVNSAVTLEGAASNSTSVSVTLTTYETTEQIVYGLLSPSGGTATPGDDYPTMPSSWELDPGPPRTNVFCCSIVVNGDSTNENDETFYLNPSLGFLHPGIRPKDTNPKNARGVVFVNQPTCTIIDDDFYLSTQMLSNNRTQLVLFGASNATYALQSSSDLVNWTSFSTKTLDSSQQASTTVTNNGKLFYRALRSVTVTE